MNRERVLFLKHAAHVARHVHDRLVHGHHVCERGTKSRVRHIPPKELVHRLPAPEVAWTRRHCHLRHRLRNRFRAPLDAAARTTPQHVLRRDNHFVDCAVLLKRTPRHAARCSSVRVGRRLHQRQHGSVVGEVVCELLEKLGLHRALVLVPVLPVQLLVLPRAVVHDAAPRTAVHGLTPPRAVRALLRRAGQEAGVADAKADLTLPGTVAARHARHRNLHLERLVHRVLLVVLQPLVHVVRQLGGRFPRQLLSREALQLEAGACAHREHVQLTVVRRPLRVRLLEALRDHVGHVHVGARQPHLLRLRLHPLRANLHLDVSLRGCVALDVAGALRLHHVAVLAEQLQLRLRQLHVRELRLFLLALRLPGLSRRSPRQHVEAHLHVEKGHPRLRFLEGSGGVGEVLVERVVRRRHLRDLHRSRTEGGGGVLRSMKYRYCS
eukprot:Rhum_TRINITY_DN5705_c1_g1::Rhum_TRINITY_DN5705_c1_g1_i1::g.18099::m.18099